MLFYSVDLNVLKLYMLGLILCLLILFCEYNWSNNTVITFRLKNKDYVDKYVFAKIILTNYTLLYVWNRFIGGKGLLIFVFNTSLCIMGNVIGHISLITIVL